MIPGVDGFEDLQIARAANGDTVITVPGYGTVTLPSSGDWPFTGTLTADHFEFFA